MRSELIAVVICAALAVNVCWSQESKLRAKAQAAPARVAVQTDTVRLAAQPAEQLVSVQVSFVADATPATIADLVFADHILALSAFGKQYSSRATYQTFGFNFSERGPPKQEQMARAMCQTAVGSQPFSDPGADAPLPSGARATFIQASVVLSASQSQRWRDQRPPLIEKIGSVTTLDNAQAQRARQLMDKVFNAKLPVIGLAQLPPGCDKYMTLKQ